MTRSQYYFTALLVLLVDCATKWLVRVKLDPLRPFDLIPGYLRFSYWENSGVAFGLFSNVVSDWKPHLLATMAVAAVVVIFIYSTRVPVERKLLRTALAIVTGGILGNFLDRIVRGAVVDFIDFHIHDMFHWPTFNVADSAITIGIALVLIDTVKNPAIETAAKPPAAGSPP